MNHTIENRKYRFNYIQISVVGLTVLHFETLKYFALIEELESNTF